MKRLHFEKNEPPIVVCPDECWFCGCSVLECPEGAIQLDSSIESEDFLETKGHQ